MNINEHIAANYPDKAGIFASFVEADSFAIMITNEILTATNFGIEETDFAVRMHLVSYA